MRSADPTAAVGRSCLPVSRRPIRPTLPAAFVKICGVTDQAGVVAAIAAGAEAIGLNVVAGTPRALEIDEAATLARFARTAGGTRRPQIVAVTADAQRVLLERIVTGIDPDVVQLSGDEAVSVVATVARRTWKVLHLPVADPSDAKRAAGAVVARGRAWLDAGADALLLDTAGGPHPGGTGVRASERLAAAVARELPITLAGGLHPATLPVRSAPSRPWGSTSRPARKDRASPANGRERIRCASLCSPSGPGRRVTIGPTSRSGRRRSMPGLLDADGAGRWGMEGDFGGRYVPETLMAALEQLETAYAALRQDPVFWSELRELLATFAGRPTALYRADRLSDAVRAEATGG